MPPRRGIRRLTQCRLTKRPEREAVNRRDGESADITRMTFVPSPGTGESAVIARMTLVPTPGSR